MTTVSEAFPSNYLKAADLNNRTVKVKIDKVVFEEIGQNRDKKPVMYFEKVKKGLVLNKTNATEIAATHGDRTKASELYKGFKEWAEATGERPGTQRAFSTAL